MMLLVTVRCCMPCGGPPSGRHLEWNGSHPSELAHLLDRAVLINLMQLGVRVPLALVIFVLHDTCFSSSAH